jgi:glycine oxidase
VDNRRLSVALAHAAAISGAQVRSYQPALSIASHGGKVEGVETPSGRIAADAVVNAAGSWSGLLVPTPKRFVGPAKGEIIALEARPRPFERVITLPGGSVSARADGRIVVGATIIDGSFSREISANGVVRMLAAATSAIPALRDARFVEAWTGLRPHSLDDQPVIGQDSISGLYWATGHFTMGILSTPATADVVASLIEGRTPRVSISSMSPRRFAQ